MKKLLAVAVAAALAAPLAATADATIYGQVNVGAVHTEPDTGDSSWDVENNASRVGVKGSEDLGGLTAVYQFEFGVDASDSGDLEGRLAFVGVAGGFGTFAMGRQTTPYYLVVDKTDVFSMDGANDHYLGPDRVGNAIAYIAPTFAGITAIAALVVTDDLDASGVDITNLAVMYNNGGLDLGVSVLDFNADLPHVLQSEVLTGVNEAFGFPFVHDGSRLWGGSAKYNFGSFAVMGQYEDLQGDNGTPDANAWGAGAEAYLGNNTIKLVYGKAEIDDLDYSEGNWAVGLDHALSETTHVWVNYNDSDIDTNKRIGAGLRMDF